MEKSESIKNIAKALITFHEHCDKIAKDSNNPFFKSKYASLSNIQESIREPLKEAGLSYSQLPEGENELYTILMHSDSGEYLQACYSMKPVKDDPQGRGSCITYQKRYALAAILGLQIDDDDDGNAASQQKKPQQQPQYKTNPKGMENNMEKHIANTTKAPVANLEVLDKELKMCNNTTELQVLWDNYKPYHKNDDVKTMFKMRGAELKPVNA